MNQRLKRLVRLPLKAIPKTMIVPILSGPNKGFRWIVGAGQHGCWLGRYERQYVDQVAAKIRPGMIAFDVGGHSGYYTLMLSRRVGPRGKVFSFEANRVNAANLRKHLQINQIDNTELIEAAVSDRSGTAHFNDDGYNSRLSDTGRMIRTVRLDDFPIPDFVKMDIEGSEGLALRGADQIIVANKTVWFIAVHGELARKECLGRLQDKYSLEWVSPVEFFATPISLPSGSSHLTHLK